MHNPPRIFLKFFRWFCHPNLLKPIEGDLIELYYERIKESGKRKADWLFAWDVLLLLRKDIVKPSDGTHSLTNYGMLQHNIKLSVRSFRRYKTSFLINLLGLSSGLASVFLIYLWIHGEWSMDKFHEHDDRLYQVLQNINNQDGTRTIEYTPALLAQALEQEIPEVKMATSALPVGSYGNDRILQFEEKKLKMRDTYASEHFFELFSYELLSGDPAKVLTQKQDVVISQDFAERLFGPGVNPLGKTVKVTENVTAKRYVISGVFKTLPDRSSIRFDAVFHIEAFLEAHPHIRKWSNSDPATYVLLEKNADPQLVSDRIKHFVESKEPDYGHTLFLQAYSDRYLYGKYENGVPVGGRIEYVRLFSIIAGLILVIACINFMNLSTARTSRRLKEIGIKKAIGAKRATLVAQHFTEATLMTFLSTLMAGTLIFMLLPFFNGLIGKVLYIPWSWPFIVIIGLVVAGTTLLAGSYPALYLSALNTTNIFRGKVTGSTNELWARKGLVIFQFSISILLITAVLVVSSQIQFIQNKDLGFRKEQVIYFDTDGELKRNWNSFISELKAESSVVNAGMFGHDFLGNMGNTSGLWWEGKGPDEYIQFANLEVGFDLIETFDLQLIEGRTFSPDFGNEQSKILFNEEAIKAMGITDPIGKKIKLWGMDREIIGVVANFHFESLHKSITPCFFQFGSELSSVVVQIQAGSEAEAIDRIQEIYQAHNPGLPFTFKFFNKEYHRLYRQEQQTAMLSKGFGAVAILISCLGLFGLVAFTSEKRQKEIGIRKVLGSSVYKLVVLLTTDFSKMVGIAVLVSIPLSYLMMNHWLNSFAYRIDLDPSFFIGPGVLAMVVAWLVMSSQTIKAASANPVESLKYE